MNKSQAFIIFSFLLFFSIPVFADCIAGWFCKDAFHRSYRDYNCEWGQVEYCPYGCQSGACNPAPNNAPSIPDVNITPDSATANDNLVCHASSDDIDGDPIEYIYKWYRNSEYYKTRVSASETNVLDSIHTKEGETWMCKVRAYDQKTYSNYGYDEITISSSQQCTPGWKCKDYNHRAYQNQDCSWSNEEFCQNGCLNGSCIGSQANNPPSDPVVFILPSPPGDSDDLVCRAYSTDPDGDNITYHFTWKKNGSTFRTFTTTNNTTTIDDSHTTEGDEWQCKVKAFDGEDYSGYSVDTVIIGPAGACGFDILIEPEYSSIHLEKNDLRGVRVKLKNTSCNDYCIDLYGRTYSNYVNANPSRNRVCLNAGESVWIALDIETVDASAGTYTAKIEARKGSLKRSATISVIVDSCDSCTNCLELISYRKNICRGETGRLRVLVKNRHNEVKDVELSASSTEFLASFEKSEIEIDAHSQKYADLEVYVYPDTRVGSRYVYIYARTDEDYARKKAYFTVKDCEEPVTQSFSITLTSACQSLEKGQDKNISFKVKNKTDGMLTVHLQAVADIPTEVQGSIDLAPNQSKILKLQVSARLDEEPGKHYVKLYGWAKNYRIIKTACIDVKKKRETVVSLAENNLSIEQCENNVFVLSIENRGDYNEDYSIEVSNSTGATITLSDKNFELSPGKGKEVFINVDIPLDMEEGDYWFDILVKNKETFTKRLYFTVKKAVEPIPYTVELTSYPYKIVLVPGEEKTISIAITNLSNEEVSDIRLEWSLPLFLSTPDSIISVKANETGLIEQTISAGIEAAPGTYYGALSMKVDDKEVSKKITIVIVEPELAIEPEKPEEEEGEGFWPFAGMVSLGTSLGIGLIILLTIVIIMIALKGFIESDRDFSKPVWHRR